MDQLVGAISLERRINIVDIGANPINVPPYKTLLDSGCCNVIGFEPHHEAFERLVASQGDRERYFETAVGDGSLIQLNIYRGSGFTSQFPICRKTTDFLKWNRGTQLQQIVEMKTTRLDDISDMPSIDLLKIDIQGGELGVFTNARNRLIDCACIITEVNFLELYEHGAPAFSDIHKELIAQGFILHKFMSTKHVNIPNSSVKLAQTQLIDGDAIYIRDIRDISHMNPWQIKCIAVFAGKIFDSPDLEQYCIDELERRGM